MVRILVGIAATWLAVNVAFVLQMWLIARHGLKSIREIKESNAGDLLDIVEACCKAVD